MAKLEVKAVKQENLFHQGKERYYIQILNSKNEQLTISVGMSTYNKLLDVLFGELTEEITEEKHKVIKNGKEVDK